MGRLGTNVNYKCEMILLNVRAVLHGQIAKATDPFAERRRVWSEFMAAMVGISPASTVKRVRLWFPNHGQDLGNLANPLTDRSGNMPEQKFDNRTRREGLACRNVNRPV
jgi:hypothetical protein